MTIRILCLMLALVVVGCDRQGAQWEAAQEEDTISAYESFIERYPETPRAEEARERIDALRMEQAWSEARQRDTIEAYNEFLEAHPDAAVADQARARMEALERAAAWQGLADSEDIEALQAFVEEYSGTAEADLARERIAELEARARAEAERRERERERQAQLEAERGTHRVQLAAVRGESQASASIERLQERFGGVLGDARLEAQRTNGLYRLVTNPMSREQAEGLCEALKEQGHDCLVRGR